MKKSKRASSRRILAGTFALAGMISMLFLAACPGELEQPEMIYDVNLAAPQNGSLTADVEKAESGTTVTLTVTPDPDYKVSSLVITGPGGIVEDYTHIDGVTYTFTMPAYSVTVTAVFEEEEEEEEKEKEEEEEEIALPCEHDYEFDRYIDATKTENGVNVSVCSMCGDEKQEEVPGTMFKDAPGITGPAEELPDLVSVTMSDGKISFGFEEGFDFSQIPLQTGHGEGADTGVYYHVVRFNLPEGALTAEGTIIAETRTDGNSPNVGYKLNAVVNESLGIASLWIAFARESTKEGTNHYGPVMGYTHTYEFLIKNAEDEILDIYRLTIEVKDFALWQEENLL